MKCRIYGKNRQWFACLLCVVLAAILLSACGDRFGKVYEEDICIESSDGQYRLIIREWGAIGGTGAEVYIEDANALIPSFTRKEIGTTAADDCMYPFADGNYLVLWESDRVIITYYSRRPGEDPTKPESWKQCIEYVF